LIVAGCKTSSAFIETAIPLSVRYGEDGGYFERIGFPQNF